MQSKDFFYCYSTTMSKYLYSNGFRYLFKAKNIDNDKVFSVYHITPELSQALREYNKTSN